MLTYILFLFFIIFLGYCWERGNATTRRFINILLMLLLCLLVGTKFNVGTDTNNYLRVFNGIATQQGLVVKFPEVGYYLINNFSAWLGLEMQFVYLICGIIIAFFTVQSARNFDINPGYYLALIFPFHIVMLAVSGIRQGVAESVVIYAISLLFLGKKNKFIFYLLLAVTFHSSALFFITLLLLGNKKRWLVLGMLVMLPSLVFFGNDAYGHYLELGLFSQGIVLRVGYLLALSFFFILYFTRCNFLNEDLIKKRFFLVSIVIPFVLFALGIISTTLVDRVAYYFILISAALFLFMLKQFPHYKSTKISLTLTLLISVVSLLVFSFLGNNAKNYTYNNYLIYLLGQY